MQQQQPGNIWNQDYYRIRKKVLAIAQQYWIEDRAGNQLGYSKQKLLKLKEDIRIFSDDTMQHELFAIKQTQIVDAWGMFAIIDSQTGQQIGGFKRKALMSALLKDEYQMCDPSGQVCGKLAEDSGMGFLRKIIPMIPETLSLEWYGQKIAEIKQKFKIIGDIWEVECQAIPPNFDRRVLLGAIILMGMVEKSRK
jgi:uncharacterized protein YxjI